MLGESECATTSTLEASGILGCIRGRHLRIAEYIQHQLKEYQEHLRSHAELPNVRNFTTLFEK